MQIRFLNVLNRERKVSGHNSCINLKKKIEIAKIESLVIPPQKKRKKRKEKYHEEIFKTSSTGLYICTFLVNYRIYIS